MARALTFIWTIGKLLAPKRDWPFPGHNYTGSYNLLEQQLKYNSETREIIEIYQHTTGFTDSVSMQHDVDHSSRAFHEQKYGENVKKYKNAADLKKNHSIQFLGKKTSGTCIRAERHYDYNIPSDR